VQECVNKRAGVAACTGMDDEACGFVDRDDVGVLVEDVDRDIFRGGFERREFLGLDFDSVAEPELVGGLARGAGSANSAVLDPGLDARAAVLWQDAGQEVIEALAGGVGSGFEAVQRFQVSARQLLLGWQ